MKPLSLSFLTPALGLLWLGLVCPALVAQNSELWGADGSAWSPESVLPDFSCVGYHRGEKALPDVAAQVSVIDFGAVGDGTTDCTEAFRKAIEESPGKVILVPAGTYRLSDRFSLGEANTVLLGGGREETILHFTRSLQEIDPKETTNAGGSPTVEWSFGGGLITLGTSSGSRQSSGAGVTEAAKRGSYTIALADTSGLEVGDACLIQVRDATDLSLLAYLYRGDPGDVSMIRTKRHEIEQAVTIAAVEGNTVTFLQPLRFDLKPEWEPQLVPFVNEDQEIGISDLTIEFPENPYRGHFNEDGWNGIEIRGINNWARRIRIRNSDSGVFVHGSWCTIDDILLEASRETDDLGFTGHHGLSLAGRESLITNFRVETIFVHDLSVDRGSVGNVFSKGAGIDLSLDNHRWAPYENLFTQLDAGEGNRVFTCGGAQGRGRHAGSGATFWNIDAKGRFDLPDEDFGHGDLVFVGLSTGSVRSSALPDGWHFEKISPDRIDPPNLHLAQLQHRLGGDGGGGSTTAGPDTETFRQWTNTDGNNIEAQFHGLTRKGVKLRMRNGKEYDYPMEKLDAASREMAKKLGGG